MVIFLKKKNENEKRNRERQKISKEMYFAAIKSSEHI